MDVQRTIEFILESQARAEVRMEKFELRMEKAEARAEARAEKADARTEKAEARMERAEARVDAMEKRLDKRMDAIAKLLRQGMQMLVKTDTRLAELAEAQKATERSLKALMDSLRTGRNGRR